MILQLATTTGDLEQQINSLGLKTVMIASLILIGCTIIAALLKNHYRGLKLPLFIIMASTLVISTTILFGSTIYLNTRAESGGPVHWHADIEFWACGAELELRNPTGRLSNKIGSATYHEHNDKRIHLEGVVVSKAEDASLSKFMRVIGGSIHDRAVTVPMNVAADDWFAAGDKTDGDRQPAINPSAYRRFIENTEKGPVMELVNGLTCGNQPAEVQVFVYSFNEDGKTYSQRKVRPLDYVVRDEAVVPPADCVILEFDKLKDRTDKLCRQYGVRDESRCTEFGVKQFDPKLCNIREVPTDVGGVIITPMPHRPELEKRCQDESKRPQGLSAECVQYRGERD